MAVCWGNLLPTPPLAAKNVTVATPLSFHLLISPQKMTCFKSPQKPQREWKGKSNQEREKRRRKRERGVPEESEKKGFLKKEEGSGKKRTYRKHPKERKNFSEKEESLERERKEIKEKDKPK